MLRRTMMACRYFWIALGIAFILLAFGEGSADDAKAQLNSPTDSEETVELDEPAELVERDKGRGLSGGFTPGNDDDEPVEVDEGRLKVRVKSVPETNTSFQKKIAGSTYTFDASFNDNPIILYCQTDPGVLRFTLSYTLPQKTIAVVK